MKGDFSRQTFRREKHYTRVLKQQGRVAMDSDWNEQEAIHAYYRKTEGTDIIGKSGAPIASPGFDIEIGKNTFSIGAGRYYVDGILCENEGVNGRPILYEQQPDLPEPDTLESITAHATEPFLLVYLDVWQRHITALDDPAMREKALGGPDTATRLKTIWQVKAVPVTFDGQPVLAILKDAGDQLSTLLAQFKANQNIVEKIQPIIDRINQVVQIDVPTTYTTLIQLISDFNDILAHISELPATLVGFPIPHSTTQNLAVAMKAKYEQFFLGIFDQQFPEWLAVQRKPTGLLIARTQPTLVTDTPCQLPPSAGYQSLDNQLYRLEILQGGDTATDTITYVWSRDNGTVVTTISSTSTLNVGDKVISVDDVGPDDDLGFARTQLVEIMDDRLELHGLPGQLTTIADIDRITHNITLSDPLAIAIEVGQHAKLRRWDGRGSITLPAGSQESDWLTLERNIQIKLLAGTYKTGDYWQVPARSMDGTIEWPTLTQMNEPPQPQALPPMGIEHHYAPLALLFWINRESRLEPINPASLSFIAGLNKKQAVLERGAFSSYFNLLHDYRTFFQALTDERPALHILGTNWNNDAVLTPSQMGQMLLQDGLIIYLDDVADPQSLINAVSLIVSVEIDSTDIIVTHYNTITILTGTIDVIANAIRWRLGQVERMMVAASFTHMAAALNLPLLRIRVQLKGNLIWNVDTGRIPTHKAVPSAWRYLDGQTLSRPGASITLPTGITRSQMQLVFPSGIGSQSSNFESWFWVDTRPQ